MAKKIIKKIESRVEKVKKLTLELRESFELSNGIEVLLYMSDKYFQRQAEKMLQR